MTVPDKIILAIDLGTTYCCSAIYRNGEITIIPILLDDDDHNDDDDDSNDSQNDKYSKNDTTMPSYVTIFNDNVLVGWDSKEQSLIHIDNTVYDIKRIIGKSYADKQLFHDKKFWSFKIINNCGKPYIQTEYMKELKENSPEQISAKLLEKIKNNAEKYLGQEINDVVITVPVYFNNDQRQATKDAAAIAGLNVIRLLNEPNAAVIAYGIDKKYDIRGTVLVVDIGGGTCDISILNVNNKISNVISTAGDNHLGGIDFDNRLTSYLIREFKNKYRSEIKKSIYEDKKVIRRLRLKCEQIKELLSEKEEVNFSINYLYEGKDLEIKIKRSKFEELISDILRRIMELLERALNEANLGKDQIDDIVMVGGSTKIPIIQAMIKDFFNGKELNNSLNPDETVASGAAIFASTLSNENQSNDIVIYETLPLTLGIETKGYKMTPIIERKTHFPVIKSRIFTTDVDNQESVKIKIYEGEHEISYKNHLLGEFILDNIPPAKHHQPQIEVTFEYDLNSILNVSATEKSTGYSNKITVVNNTNKLSKAEIEQQIQEANKSREEEKKEKERVSFMNNLIRYVEDLHNKINDQTISLRIKTSDKEELEAKVKSTKEWIDDNSKASKHEIIEQRDTLERMALPILNKL